MWPQISQLQRPSVCCAPSLPSKSRTFVAARPASCHFSWDLQGSVLTAQQKHPEILKPWEIYEGNRWKHLQNCVKVKISAPGATKARSPFKPMRAAAMAKHAGRTSTLQWNPLPDSLIESFQKLITPKNSNFIISFELIKSPKFNWSSRPLQNEIALQVTERRLMTSGEGLYAA